MAEPPTDPGSASPLLVIAGVGTEVGKTWVAEATIAAARHRGHRVAVRKPAQSFASGEQGSTDADVLATASGEDAFDVCPEHRWYEAAMAPVMAAEVLQRPAFTITDLVAEVADSWPSSCSLRIVETAGGLRSPLSVDGDSLNLIEALRPDLVVVVADAGLGTLNDCRMAHDLLAGFRNLVILNRFDPDDDLHRRNLEWLQGRESMNVVTNGEISKILDELSV